MRTATFTTVPHRVAASTYMRAVAWEWFGSWWWLVALPPAATAVALAEGSLQWAVVGFTVICLLMPLTAMMLYFRYALTEESAAQVRLHSVTLSRGEFIRIDAVTPPEEADEAEANQPPSRSYPSLVAEWSAIERTELTGDYVVFWQKDKPYRPLMVPKSLLPEQWLTPVAE